jgi:uncharacterized OsmC-like protein
MQSVTRQAAQANVCRDSDSDSDRGPLMLDNGEMSNSEELRAVQAPLKQQYRDEPAAALITLRASGELGAGVTCSVATGRAIVEAGLHPATGGDGLSLCSGDMLLEALVACAGVTLRAVATSLDLPVRAGRVLAEGDLDFRGTLAVAKDAPVGFAAIRLRFELDSEATEEQLDTLIRLTERYCVVLQTIRTSPEVSVSRAEA